MRNEFRLAINALCAERKLSPDVVLEAVEASLVSAYRRDFGAANNIDVQIDSDTGEVRVFSAREVVEEVTDPKLEISLPEARRVEPEAELGGTVLIETTPRDFGRIAAQTAKQVILQRIREAERDALYSSFADSAGEIAMGTIQSQDYHSGDVIVNLEGAEAVLPAREQVPGEPYRRGYRLRAYVLDVRKGNRGPHITLSRRTPALLRRLLELEVPEIFSGAVEIQAIAREAGSRSKVAVHAVQEGVDPVGSCVGVRGGRIQNVVSELNGEKIDVVQWDSEVSTFIANSLSPAKVMNVLLSEDPESGKTATVIVPDRQLSLAIGKEGQNARLAAKLTGWRIDIKSATEAAEETLGPLQAAPLSPDEMDLLTLAEDLLKKDLVHGAEQRKIIIEAVSEQDLPEPWPPNQPVEAADAEDVREGEATETLPKVEEAVPAAEAAEAVEAPAAVAEKPAAEVEGEPVEAPSLEIGEDGVEDEPPFEGEPVADSIGWVRTEPELDYYSGWAEEEDGEEEEEAPDYDWVREELDDELFEAQREKKKGKKRRRREYYEPEDLDLSGKRPGRRGRSQDW